jgi:predicted branched-subunit amino acid permease
MLDWRAMSPDDTASPDSHPDRGAREGFRRGFRELAPVTPGVLAWGLVTGIAMAQSGLTLAQSLGMTLAAYAGSAQLAALPLIAAAAPAWVVTLTAIIVNLRFVIYSVALRPHFRHRTRGARLALGYFTGDITFVQFVTMLENDPTYPHRIAYFAGASACNWIAWQVGSIAGILGAGFIRPDTGLELAGTLALVALVVPLCTRMPALAGVLAAGAVAVFARHWPLKLGLLAGVICGIAIAMLVEGAAGRSRKPA